MHQISDTIPFMRIESSVNLDTYKTPPREPNFLRSFAALAITTSLMFVGIGINNEVEGKHTGAVAAEDYLEQDLGFVPAHRKETRPHDPECGTDQPPSYDFEVPGPTGNTITVTVCDDSGTGFSLRQS